MSEQVSLNAIVAEIEDLKRTASELKDEQEKKAGDEEMKKEDKAMDAKKAKRASRDAAIKKAMDMDDEDEKDAAVKKAMDDYDDKKEDKKEAKKAMTDEEKEKDAQVASILQEKRNETIHKILSAHAMKDPATVQEVDIRLKKASITEINQEWNVLKTFFGNVAPVAQTMQPDIIPYYANNASGTVDEAQLNASSPDHMFAKMKTSELLGRRP